jgi:hypothetical protein
MTITATIAGAVSMVAQFGMFFRGGNRDSNNGLGIVGSVLMLILAPLTSNERLIEIGNGCSDTRHDLFRHPNVKKSNGLTGIFSEQRSRDSGDLARKELAWSADANGRHHEGGGSGGRFRRDLGDRPKCGA